MSKPKQVIDVRGSSPLPPAQVWQRLSDSARYPDWTPVEEAKVDRPAAEGVTELRSLRTGRYLIREEVVERREPERLSYVLLSGLPLKDYRAEIDLSARADGGTDVRWHTTFDPKLPGTGWLYRRGLERTTRQFVAGLTRADRGHQ